MEDNLAEENRKLEFHLLEDAEVYRIRMYGDPVLHEKALPIEAITEEEQQIAKISPFLGGAGWSFQKIRAYLKQKQATKMSRCSRT